MGNNDRAYTCECVAILSHIMRETGLGRAVTYDVLFLIS